MQTVRHLLKVSVVVGAVALAMAGACAGVFYLTDRDGWNKRHFDRIVLGGTRAELVELLGEEPDCIVRVRKSEAWFYRGAMGPAPCVREVEAPAQLPTAYGTLQILVGPDGRVRAIAMDGERYLKLWRGPSPGGATLQSVPSDEVE